MSKISGKLKLVALAAVLVSLPATSFASGVSDPVGDFLPTYIGPHGADLDVTNLQVDISGANFVITSTFAGNVGATPGGFYVFGVDRGHGLPLFAGNGLPGVLFDSVVVVQQNGTGIVNLFGPVTALAPGSVTINGNVLTTIVPISLLPSTGFAANRYGWNLWPRSPGGSGFNYISDFAPANSTIAAIPEPASWAMMFAGFGLAGLALRRRAAARA